MWTFISACVSVCGDNTCELEENSLTCPADCGVCPMPTSIKVTIGLPVALFCSVFFLNVGGENAGSMLDKYLLI